MRSDEKNFTFAMKINDCEIVTDVSIEGRDLMPELA
jgi:hypothetical protein